MKKAIILALLLSTFGCTKSSTDDVNATKNELSEVPADAIIFVSGHRTKAWDQYIKKYKLDDVSYMKKIWTSNIVNFTDPIKGIDSAELASNTSLDEQTITSLQKNLENAEQLSNDIIEGFQKYGTIGVDGKDPRINTQIFYVTPSNNTVLNASFLADGVDMPSSLSFIKSLFTKNNVPQSAMQFAGTEGFNYGNIVNFAANEGRLAISTDTNTINDKLAHKTATTDITSQPAFAELYDKVDHDDAISTAFINIEALLQQFVNSKNQTNEIAKSISQFVDNVNKEIPGGDLLAINPVKAVLVSSKMNDLPSNTYAVSFKKTNNPDINKALVPYNPKGTNSIFQTVPANTDIILSLDGILFENIQKLLPQEAAMATAVAAPYIAGTKSLNIVARFASMDDSATPEITFILEGSVANSLSQLITSMMSPTTTTVDGVTLSTTTAPAGFQIYMTTSGENLIISNSDKFIVETVNGKKKLWDEIPAENKKAIKANTFISSYFNMDKLADMMKNIKKEAGVYGVKTADFDLIEPMLHQKNVSGISFDGNLLLINSSNY